MRPGAQQPVRSDSGHVPAQQVGSEVAQIGPDAGREVVARVRATERRLRSTSMPAAARPGPVPGTAAGGRGIDHGRRHGELAHARPEGGGVPSRWRSITPPCADGSPNLASGGVVIAGSIAAPAPTCQVFFRAGGPPGAFPWAACRRHNVSGERSLPRGDSVCHNVFHNTFRSSSWAPAPPGSPSATSSRAAGVDCLVLETGTREFIERRPRAGVIEEWAVRGLERRGLARNLLERAQAHTECEFRFDGARYRFGDTGLTGRHHFIYPQQFLVTDLVREYADVRGGGDPVRRTGRRPARAGVRPAVGVVHVPRFR